MPGLESGLPEAFKRAVADGTLRAGLMLAHDQDAFGQPLEAMLEQVFTTAEEIVAATDEMKADFRIDGVYGEEDEQDVRLALPGYTPDLKDFTGVVCIAAGPGGEPFCLDFRADAAPPSSTGIGLALPPIALPPIALPSTRGGEVDPGRLTGAVVLYCYPRTGLPDSEPPGGLALWDSIPGARGCTPQACSYRDHHAELRATGAQVFAISTQDTDYQRELAERLHLPFPVLSDAGLRLTQALRLPTFECAGFTLLRRLTMIVRDGRIVERFYPVFPPGADAERVMGWLRVHRAEVS